MPARKPFATVFLGEARGKAVLDLSSAKKLTLIPDDLEILFSLC